ncbi:MAG: hypothetical protein CMQ40_00840 [Gammaproteobacteria bacterium]|nr:hypothetical protein [Gammaproteobacteria bacterium]
MDILLLCKTKKEVVNKKMEEKLESRLTALGISTDMIRACKLSLHSEPENLVGAGIDIFGRNQKMTFETRNAWVEMKTAAFKNNIDIKLVSAFRSINYQCNLIKEKLDAGMTIEEILRVNAIPGFSEHHYGRAIDLHSGTGKALEKTFDTEPAFFWLTKNAKNFGFVMSYPENNPEGLSYEPWHWCYIE